MSGPDIVTAKDTSTSYAPAPEGQHQAVAVDVVNLGERVETFQGQNPKVVQKVALVYQIDEVNPDTGKRFEIAVEKTLTFGEKAGLRKWLEAWRGKKYGDEEARTNGAPLHKLVGVNGLITVEHKTSKQGRVYGMASNITPLPKGMTPIAPSEYQRADYWAKRKEEYAGTVAAHRAIQGGPHHDEPPPLPEDDDDLPF